MSKDSSPGHQFSGARDSFYDPDYALQISSKMQVPDRITVVDRRETTDNSVPFLHSGKILMQVPERILVAGGDEHIKSCEPLPELFLESSFPLQQETGIVLTAPPHVLTVGEYHYPILEETRTTVKEIVNQPPQQSVNSTTEVRESNLNTSHNSEDDVVILRKQIRHLNRRVSSLEQVLQLQQQREIILYSAGVIYFVIKGIVWLHRHF